MRPERIAVGEEAKKLENQMEGTVESYIYQGSAVLINIRINDKTLMKVRVPATSEVVNILKSGKPLTIG
ncbi:MAG: TOBE domain-containing protein [Candidatus Baldrarchaeia archaeon]